MWFRTGADSIFDCCVEDKYSARCHGYNRKRIPMNRAASAMRAHTYTQTPSSFTTCRWNQTILCVCMGTWAIFTSGNAVRVFVCNEHLWRIWNLYFKRQLTHRHSGDGGDKGIDEDRRRLTVVLWSWVWLGIGFVETEEALDMHGERVRVFKVICQQNGPCHDDQLEIKHIGCSVTTESTGVGKRQKAAEDKSRKQSLFLHNAKWWMLMWCAKWATCAWWESERREGKTQMKGDR